MKNEKYNASGVKDITAFDAVNAADMEMEVSRRPVVYICSPYSGDTERNKANARRYSRFACLHGAIPFTPHILFTQYLDDDIKSERTLAMCMNRKMIRRCDELWAFGNNISPGMKEEIAFAKKNGIRIRYFTKSCREVCG